MAVTYEDAKVAVGSIRDWFRHPQVMLMTIRRRTDAPYGILVGVEKATEFRRKHPRIAVPHASSELQIRV